MSSRQNIHQSLPDLDQSLQKQADKRQDEKNYK